MGRSASVAAVGVCSSEATKAKLLQPLLFPLQLQIGSAEDPMISLLHVHQGDNPAQLAQSFLARFTGWNDPAAVAKKVEDAILAKVEELNAERSKATAEDAADGTAEE